MKTKANKNARLLSLTLFLDIHFKTLPQSEKNLLEKQTVRKTNFQQQKKKNHKRHLKYAIMK